MRRGRANVWKQPLLRQMYLTESESFWWYSYVCRTCDGCSSFWEIFCNSNLMTGHLRFPASMLDESFYKLAMRHGLKYTDFIHPCAFAGYAPFMFAGRLVVVVMLPTKSENVPWRVKTLYDGPFLSWFKTLFCNDFAFIIYMNILVCIICLIYYSNIFFLFQTQDLRNQPGHHSLVNLHKVKKKTHKIMFLF